MAQPVIQHSFHAGEWAPELNARVDLQKYRSGAALLRNFFVDYRGGASSCPGTKYVLQAYKSASKVRLIPFQASFSVTYVLEFGDFYIRFFNNGSPILESGLNITNVSGNVITVANTYSVGDWVFVTGVNGISNINGNFYIVSVAAAGSITVTDLFGNAVSFTGVWTSGGTTARVYTLPSPFAAADLGLIKFAQVVNTMVLCHNSYSPQVLTLISANNWTLTPIQFGPSLLAPTGASAATNNAGGAGNQMNAGYVVTAVDVNGIESSASSSVSTTANTSSGAVTTLTINWTAEAGAIAYNVYRSPLSPNVAVSANSQYGYVVTVPGPPYLDAFVSGSPLISPDFSISPPIVDNPFQGGSIASVTVTAAGTYGGSTIPTATFAAAPTGGATATALVYAGVTATGALSLSDNGFTVGELLTPNLPTIYKGVVLKVAAVGGGSHPCTAVTIYNPGAIPQGTAVSATAVFKDSLGNQVTVALTIGVTSLVITYGGAGYASAPAITFSGGAATATSTLTVVGNPALVGFFDQRLVFGSPLTAINTLYFSQPGSFYNFNVSNPIQADNSITASLIGASLNTVKSLVPMSQGLVVFSDKSAWLVTGGGVGVPISAIDINARQQAYNGANDLPPIVVNFDIIYNQAKGGYFRDLTFNFYTQIYTGTDISVLSSHLFYGHTFVDWAYAEEPFKMIHVVRDDGVMLLLTFLKEQEIVGWAHRDTTGLFKSVCSVVEAVTLSNGLVMNVDAVYTVVQRTINSQTVQYIERVAERIFPNGATDAWCVDAGIQYSGAPATTFTGAQHLAGQTVTGLADGVVIPSFVMPANGSFTLSPAASKVTVGLAFVPQLQTLRLDLGEPTAQGKRKKITAVTVRCKETLGLTIGKAFTNMVTMKDLVVGNVGTMSNTVVTDLVSDDARTTVDPSWDVPGQYCIQQSNPLPASILGVIPEIVVGDTPK